MILYACACLIVVAIIGVYIHWVYDSSTKKEDEKHIQFANDSTLQHHSITHTLIGQHEDKQKQKQKHNEETAASAIAKLNKLIPDRKLVPDDPPMRSVSWMFTDGSELKADRLKPKDFQMDCLRFYSPYGVQFTQYLNCPPIFQIGNLQLTYGASSELSKAWEILDVIKFRGIDTTSSQTLCPLLSDNTSSWKTYDSSNTTQLNETGIEQAFVYLMLDETKIGNMKLLVSPLLGPYQQVKISFNTRQVETITYTYSKSDMFPDTTIHLKQLSSSLISFDSFHVIPAVQPTPVPIKGTQSKMTQHGAFTITRGQSHQEDGAIASLHNCTSESHPVFLTSNDMSQPVRRILASWAWAGIRMIQIGKCTSNPNEIINPAQLWFQCGHEYSSTLVVNCAKQTYPELYVGSYEFKFDADQKTPYLQYKDHASVKSNSQKWTTVDKRVDTNNDDTGKWTFQTRDIDNNMIECTIFTYAGGNNDISVQLNYPNVCQSDGGYTQTLILNMMSEMRILTGKHCQVQEYPGVMWFMPGIGLSEENEEAQIRSQPINENLQTRTHFCDVRPIADQNY